MAQEGAKVVITGRTKSKLEETCNKIRSGGLAADFIVGDVSKVEDIKAIIQKVLKEDGKIDVLVNNAALLTKAVSIENITEEEWDTVMRVNLKGPFLCCREVVPHMKARRSGKIINIGSTAAFLTFWRVFPYATCDLKRWSPSIHQDSGYGDGSFRSLCERYPSGTSGNWTL